MRYKFKMNSFKKHALAAAACKMTRHVAVATLLAMPVLLLPATSARADSLVLLYNGNTGTADTGFVDTNGNFTDLNVYTTVGDWTHIVGLGGGLVLFYNSVGFARTYFVDTNGNFTPLKFYTGFAPWTHVVGLGGGLVLFYNEFTGVAETGSVG